MKQLSVFVENRVGAISEVTGILADKGVDIRALCIADTSDFGIMRMIVSDCEYAAQSLRGSGFIVNLTDVIAVETDNKPGAFHNVLTVLAQAGVFVEYSYAFLSSSEGKAHFIIKTNDTDMAEKALADMV